MAKRKAPARVPASRKAQPSPKLAKEPKITTAFPIVGIGASAGGLEAFERLLRKLSAHTNMALVFIQHLDPKHESRLQEILTRASPMPVHEARDGMHVFPNHVYVIPPNQYMRLKDGKLQLEPRKDSSLAHLPIDLFFRSLAEEEKNRAIGVILSGTASDGVGGMKAIKTEGGITFAQDASSAKYYGMPHSSINAGAVDFVLAPEDIATYLMRIGKHPYIKLPPQDTLAELRGGEAVEHSVMQLYGMLNRSYRVDFSVYKQTTINRRIKRRMALNNLEKIDDYLKFVRGNSDELRSLFHDMFIGITSFFREPEFFAAWEKIVLPKILKNRSEDEPVRVWVPGCSTGEEVYSIAITILHHLRDKNTAVPVQIFGTDINEEAIKRARHGKYPESIAQDVGAARLRQYFVKTGEGYQVNKLVRDICVFAKHDVVRDPPFSRLDILSCRNVLIYLGPRLHQRLLPLFHYTLRPNGFLLLGSAETVGGFANLFALVDRKHKIYARKPASLRPKFEASEYPVEPVPPRPLPSPQPVDSLEVQKETSDMIILNQYAPPSVLVNESMDILHFRGHTGRYLEPAPGAPSMNLLKMARQGLIGGLRSAFQSAVKRRIPSRAKGLHVESNGHERLVNVNVVPVEARGVHERTFLVLFEELPEVPALAKGKGKAAAGADTAKDAAARERTTQLKQELLSTKAYLQSVIENQEASNEELRSLNEEIMSTNEELQSTTEELETANEELQSANEELTTLNEELQNRNAELSTASNDILNLLNSMNLSIVIVDRELRIRRYTPTAQKTLNLIVSDIGRPLTDIRLPVAIDGFEDLLVRAMETALPQSKNVKDREDRSYTLLVRPYITAENKIDGAVVVLTDVQELTRVSSQLETANAELQNRLLEQRQTEAAYRDSEQRLELIAQALPQMIGYFDMEERLQFANRSFESATRLSSDQIRQRPLSDVVGEAAYKLLKPYVAKSLSGARASYRGPLEFARGGERYLQVDFLPRIDLSGRVVGSNMLISDFTEMQQSTVLEERSRMARDLHDTLAQMFVGIALHLEGAAKSLPEEHVEVRHHLQRALQLSRQGVENARASIRALQATPDAPLHKSLEILAEELKSASTAQITVAHTGAAPSLASERRENLLHILQEAMRNSVRHGKASKINVQITYATDKISAIVEDNGRGIPASRRKSSDGQGLTFMKERAELAKATLRVSTQPGKGTRVELTAALAAPPAE